MRSEAQRQDQARRLVEKLVKISPDAGLTARVLKMRARLALPMSVVLDRVPGGSVIAKAAACKVSRQTVYYWLNGTTRPSAKQAELLAKLTGFDAGAIRGVSP